MALAVRLGQREAKTLSDVKFSDSSPLRCRISGPRAVRDGVHEQCEELRALRFYRWHLVDYGAPVCGFTWRR